MEDQTKFKCPHLGCQYSIEGNKSFKKKHYLSHHLKNVHGSKEIKCKRCCNKFAFYWQLDYHLKFCGSIFQCANCPKVYSKPTSLIMHCKRKNHTALNCDKPVMNNIQTQNGLPVLVLLQEPIIYQTIKTTRPILPKMNETLNVSEHLLTTTTKKSTSTTTTKRSTECQTARKRIRTKLPKYEQKSIQTQTIFSSFNETNHQVVRNDLSLSLNKTNETVSNQKCSSFTQTFIDDFDDKISDPIKEDAFLVNDMQYFDQSAQTEEFPITLNEMEHQSKINFDDSNGGNEEQFKFPSLDIEFIDIETQTIWNYDRTTQTDLINHDEPNEKLEDLLF